MTVEYALNVLGHMKNLITVRVFEEEALEMAMNALQELELYKQGGLCLVPADTFEKQRPVIHKKYYGCKNCGAIKSMRQKNPYCYYCGKGFDWENPEHLEGGNL